MRESFIPLDSFHAYITKSSENMSYMLHGVKGFRAKSFAYNGCVLWDKLTSSIKVESKLYNFKLSVKNTFLIGNYFFNPINLFYPLVLIFRIFICLSSIKTVIFISMPLFVKTISIIGPQLK
jgi:hypothetical protein